MKNYGNMSLASGIFILAILFATFGVTSVTAKTVTFNNLNIPIKSGGPVFTPNFTVSNKGVIKIDLAVKISNMLGAGQSVYVADLMKANSNVVLATKEFWVTNYFNWGVITYNVPSCGDTGNYRIRIQNTSIENPQSGIATFKPFNAPDIDPVTGPLSTFSVAQGLTEDRSIPTSPINLQPSGTGGKMRITANWTSICGADPAGCRLTFRLKRNGTTMASSIGYAHNAMFGNASPKMTIEYNVPANQVSGNWSLQVAGAASGSATNVKPTVKFTPVCQN